ncbi:hypothetical protein UlMin_036482 [Ulmus minor]
MVQADSAVWLLYGHPYGLYGHPYSLYGWPYSLYGWPYSLYGSCIGIHTGCMGIHLALATIIHVYAFCSILYIVIFCLRIKTKNNIVGVKGVCFVIFCEVIAIYGVIVAIILQTKLESVPVSQIYAPESLRAGYAIFSSGIIVGFVNLVYGLCAGIIGSSCALSDDKNSSLFVIEIFGSPLGLFGVIVGIIMSSQATWPTKA